MSRELTVGDIVNLVTSAKAVLEHFAPDGAMPNPPRVHDALFKFDTGTVGTAEERGVAKAKGLVDMLSEDLVNLKIAIAHFEVAPAGVGRVSAGKK